MDGHRFLGGSPEPFDLWYCGIPNGTIEIHVAGATPFCAMTLLASTGHGGATNIPAGFPCCGDKLSLKRLSKSLGTIADVIDGKANSGPVFVPAAAIGCISVQSIDLWSCTVTNAVTVFD